MSLVLLQIDHKPHRLAVTAPARGVADASSVEEFNRSRRTAPALSVDLRRVWRGRSASPALELQLVDVVLMALERRESSPFRR